ncbi:type II secretion system F family protein [Tessaracoccus sp. OS52]|uniref:type II secretion system F family protein n=1 Tax=Tessaracoccus sp. OS52 TaxID=2886691 RepID=UPI001D130705|nr:type II secretion system F family protein [Tessaracoccus sp. OS52]
MEPLIAAGVGALTALGIVLVAVGLTPREPSTQLSPILWERLGALWESLSPRRQVWVVGALLAGVVTAAVTGWIVAMVVVPALVIGIPSLLSEPPQREIDVLAGLDRWVRLLAPSIATGKSIRDAIIATRHQAPAALSAPVARLVARIDQGWTTRDALLAMADDLNCADGDAVLAALAIAASRGGAGTRATLSALSTNTQERLRTLREISAERAKPRAVVRQVTFITLAVLGVSILLGGDFFAPYRTPLGQALALGLATIYMGALAMLRRRTVPTPGPRFLRSTAT